MRRIGSLLPRTLALLALLGAAAALGGLIGRPGLRATRAPEAGRSSSAPASPPAGEIAELRAALEANTRALQELRELAVLEANALVDVSDEVDAIQRKLRAEPAAAGSRSSGAPASSSATASHSDIGESLAEEPPEINKSPLFDEQALIDAGLAPYRARELRERYEQSVLDRLYLRDQAAREGWLRTKRFRLSNLKLAADLREELGPESYDEMLFATGQKNRLRVTHVLTGSSAAQAGVAPGDTILRYEGKRVFNIFELRGLTQQGEPGETVELEVDRAGQRLRLRVPRGPLGATFTAAKTQPRAAP